MKSMTVYVCMYVCNTFVALYWSAYLRTMLPLCGGRLLSSTKWKGFDVSGISLVGETAEDSEEPEQQQQQQQSLTEGLQFAYTVPSTTTSDPQQVCI